MRLKDEMSERKKQLFTMEKQYDHLVEELGVVRADMNAEERIVFRVARIFGECELNMPAGFLKEVKAYIRKWKASDRLNKAIQRGSGGADAFERCLKIDSTNTGFVIHLIYNTVYNLLKKSDW